MTVIRVRVAEGTRQDLEAALELFVENGFEDTTVQQIAARAGVGRSTSTSAPNGTSSTVCTRTSIRGWRSVSWR